MLCCAEPVEYALASALHSSMMAVIARDVEGLDGWGPWCKALKEPLLPLLWPALLSQLLQVDPLFDALYGDNRADIVAQLDAAEWASLSPEVRLQLLCAHSERRPQRRPG